MDRRHAAHHGGGGGVDRPAIYGRGDLVRGGGGADGAGRAARVLVGRQRDP